MPMWVKDSGVWRVVPLLNTQVRVAGVWRSAIPWVKVAGEWRKAGHGLVTTLTAATSGPLVGYSQGFMGAIGADTYLDAGGTSRTIIEVVRSGSNLSFSLSGGGIPDSDGTFKSITVWNTAAGGNYLTYVRSARTGFSNGGGISTWVWSSASTVFVSGATHDFKVNF